MKARNPQLTLRLDAVAPDAGARWCDGAPLAYLGGAVILRLGTKHREAILEQGQVHLPLPPEATARQIQDAAESWLRARAQAVIAAQVTLEARKQGRSVPACTLSFSARSGWAQADGKGGLRFQWRLVEQPAEVIAQVVARAVGALPHQAVAQDLFGFPA